MSEAEGWNAAYARGTLRRKRDMDYIMPEPTDTTHMRPDMDDSPELAGKILVGGLIAVAFFAIAGILIAEALS